MAKYNPAHMPKLKQGEISGEFWMRAGICEERERTSGFSLGEIYAEGNFSLALIKDKKSRHYGKLGIPEVHSGDYARLKSANREKDILVKYKSGGYDEYGNSDESKIPVTPNLEMILKEREKLFKLF